MEFSWPEITSGTKQSLSVAVFRQAAFWSGGGILHYRTMSSFLEKTILYFFSPLILSSYVRHSLLSFLPFPPLLQFTRSDYDSRSLVCGRGSHTVDVPVPYEWYLSGFWCSLKGSNTNRYLLLKVFPSALPASASFYFIVILNIFSLIRC